MPLYPFPPRLPPEWGPEKILNRQKLARTCLSFTQDPRELWVILIKFYWMVIFCLFACLQIKLLRLASIWEMLASPPVQYKFSWTTRWQPPKMWRDGGHSREVIVYCRFQLLGFGRWPLTRGAWSHIDVRLYTQSSLNLRGRRICMHNSWLITCWHYLALVGNSLRVLNKLFLMLCFLQG